MKNITFSADEKLIARARSMAEQQGKSLNRLVRDFLEKLASGSDQEAEFARLRELSQQADGQRGDWRFDREQLHLRK